MRENTYFPDLCLIQIGTPDEAAAIDPKADGLDLAPLLDLLVANHDVLKVFHAGGQDLEIIHNITGRMPVPLFDTQIAAMVAGFGDQVSYDGLCRALAGVSIEKAHRFSDWSARPLSASQVAYAAADVTHLRRVYTALRERLARTRWPDQAPGAPWAHGTDVAYLQSLVAHWRDTFDWRRQEARLNAWPHFKVALHGIDLHYLHVPGKGPKPCPLLLSHGWPGSVFEFLELIPRLTDPARFGGDPADAFTVVAPSLPGYGLSFAPGQPRFSAEAIA